MVELGLGVWLHVEWIVVGLCGLLLVGEDICRTLVLSEFGSKRPLEHLDW